MTTIKAHFDGIVFVPDQPVQLPANESVTLHFEPASNGFLTAAEVEDRLKALAELEKMAEEEGAGEADWSRESIYSGTLDDPR